MAVKGGKIILHNMGKLNEALRKATQVELMEAGAFIEGKSKDTTPVRSGNLKSSHYNDPIGTEKNPGVEIGLHANYAPFVHENVNANFTTGRAKFLQLAVYENVDKIIRGLQRGIARRLKKR